MVLFLFYSPLLLLHQYLENSALTNSSVRKLFSFEVECVNIDWFYSLHSSGRKTEAVSNLEFSQMARTEKSSQKTRRSSEEIVPLSIWWENEKRKGTQTRHIFSTFSRIFCLLTPYHSWLDIQLSGQKAGCITLSCLLACRLFILDLRKAWK